MPTTRQIATGQAPSVAAGSVTNASVATNAAIAKSKIATAGTWAIADLPAGTVILINADETQGTDINTQTSESTSKSYSLAANSYTKIIAEGEAYLYTDTAAQTTQVRIYIGTTVTSGSESIYPVVYSLANLGNPGQVLPIKLSAAQTAAATIKITIQPGNNNVRNGGAAFSLRVYGVV